MTLSQPRLDIPHSPCLLPSLLLEPASTMLNESLFLKIRTSYLGPRIPRVRSQDTSPRRTLLPLVQLQDSFERSIERLKWHLLVPPSNQDPKQPRKSQNNNITLILKLLHLISPNQQHSMRPEKPLHRIHTRILSIQLLQLHFQIYTNPSISSRQP